MRVERRAGVRHVLNEHIGLRSIDGVDKMAAAMQKTLIAAGGIDGAR